MPNSWDIESHEELDSTNRLAAVRVREAWDRQESSEGKVIVAQHQTAGRGQHGRTWASPPGGLYLSAVVEAFPVELRHRVALVAGFAVAAFVERTTSIAPTVRWPNDILLGGRKLAGILCEAVAQGDRWAVIIGIGLNLNTRRNDLPSELQNAATSLMETDGQHRNLEPFTAVLLRTLSNALAEVHQGRFLRIVDSIRARDALLHQPVRLMHRGTLVEGVGAGINDDGSLRLRMPDGSIHSFEDGSISAAMAASK